MICPLVVVTGSLITSMFFYHRHLHVVYSIQDVLFTWLVAKYSIEGWALGRLVCSLLAQMGPTRQFCGVHDLKYKNNVNRMTYSHC